MVDFTKVRGVFCTVLEACAEEGVMTLFHTGQIGIGSGMRGGMGMWPKYSIPMHLGGVAVDFPDMPIVLAHPSFPWTEEDLAVCQNKPNVHYDMTCWSPKHFSETAIRYANSILKRKILFGLDRPAVAKDHWLADFEKAPFRDEVRPSILKEDTLRLLGEADG